MNHVQSRNSKYTENKPSKTQTFSITFQVINGISCTVAKKKSHPPCQIEGTDANIS